MDAGSFFLGALAGGVVTYAGALIAALRRLHRQANPGHSCGPLASNQDPAYLEAQYQAYRQAAQQQAGPAGDIDWSPEAWARAHATSAAYAAIFDDFWDSYLSRPTTQQPEASNQRSNEATGGLGNIPSNVVSPKGWSNETREAWDKALGVSNPSNVVSKEGWRAWEVTPPPSEREVEIRRGNGPIITRVIPCQQNPEWNIANVYWRYVSREG